MLETLSYHMIKSRVYISLVLGKVPERDRHQSRQTDGQTELP